MNPNIIYNLGRLKQIKGTAAFSADKTYRYLLTRDWGNGDKAINFLMMNPSIADEKILDPTVRKCLQWAIIWGFNTLLVTNIFAYRSTEMKKIFEVEDPIGPDNDEYIEMAFEWCKNSGGQVVCAFGNHGSYMTRDLTVRTIAARVGVELHCLKMNQDGSPQHPLYIKKSTTPKIWRTHAETVNDIQP